MGYLSQPNYLIRWRWQVMLTSLASIWTGIYHYGLWACDNGHCTWYMFDCFSHSFRSMSLEFFSIQVVYLRLIATESPKNQTALFIVTHFQEKEQKFRVQSMAICELYSNIRDGSSIGTIFQWLQHVSKHALVNYMSYVTITVPSAKSCHFVNANIKSSENRLRSPVSHHLRNVHLKLQEEKWKICERQIHSTRQTRNKSRKLSFVTGCLGEADSDKIYWSVTVSSPPT